jgi:hypothetical protein
MPWFGGDLDGANFFGIQAHAVGYAPSDVWNLYLDTIVLDTCFPVSEHGFGIPGGGGG